MCSDIVDYCTLDYGVCESADASHLIRASPAGIGTRAGDPFLSAERAAQDPNFSFGRDPPRWKDIFASWPGKGKAVNLYKKRAQTGVYTNAFVFALGLLQYNFVKPR
jgi:hypothetical protein